MSVQKTFCTTREAASLLGISLSTAQNWAEVGLLDSWRTEGGHRRISRESVTRLLADPLQAELGGVGAKRAARDRLKILVVEDDPVMTRLYQVRLAGWAVAPIVDTAADGFEGLVKIGLQRPDLLISDLQMPHLDGFQMIRSLSGLSDCARMRIVVVSGLSPDDIRAAGGLPESIVIFPKPVPFGDLEAIAEGIVEQRKRVAA
jgi:excisionase family DNA binding protein